VIAAVIGFGVFIGINTSVNIYLFVATPCC
jgi:hypothetical protein